MRRTEQCATTAGHTDDVTAALERQDEIRKLVSRRSTRDVGLLMLRDDAERAVLALLSAHFEGHALGEPWPTDLAEGMADFLTGEAYEAIEPLVLDELHIAARKLARVAIWEGAQRAVKALLDPIAKRPA